MATVGTETVSPAPLYLHLGREQRSDREIRLHLSGRETQHLPFKDYLCTTCHQDLNSLKEGEKKEEGNAEGRI